ncbi:MAG TPA: DUF5668 domain-containing protein [Gammaproteobacteria bacterium]|nr:DUF5668 domain-containing protein [Gammaproteobacteria bacterium]
MEPYRADRCYRYGGGFAAGIVIILIGLFFLLNNFGIHFPFMLYHNWWALFILIASIGPLSYAWQRYRRLGRMDGNTLHSLISGCAIIIVALFFLLDLDWGLWWPVFIIIGGFYTLAGNWRRGSDAGRSKPNGTV